MGFSFDAIIGPGELPATSHTTNTPVNAALYELYGFPAEKYGDAVATETYNSRDALTIRTARYRRTSDRIVVTFTIPKCDSLESRLGLFLVPPYVTKQPKPSASA